MNDNVPVDDDFFDEEFPDDDFLDEDFLNDTFSTDDESDDIDFSPEDFTVDVDLSDDISLPGYLSQDQIDELLDNPQPVQQTESQNSVLDQLVERLVAAGSNRQTALETVEEAYRLGSQDSSRDSGEYSDPGDVENPAETLESLLKQLSDRAIQKVIRDFDRKELPYVLLNTSGEIQNRFFSNLSRRAVVIMKEDMECLGGTPVAHVEFIQRKMLRVIHDLEYSGEICFSNNTDEEITV